MRYVKRKVKIKFDMNNGLLKLKENLNKCLTAFRDVLFEFHLKFWNTTSILEYRKMAITPKNNDPKEPKLCDFS